MLFSNSHTCTVVEFREKYNKSNAICKFFFDAILFQLHYISPNLGGGGTASPSAFTSVFAYIGSPPQLRRQSRLSWRQGPLYLLEDIVSSSVVSSIYKLGPTYVGSLQAPLSGNLILILFRSFLLGLAFSFIMQ